MPERPMRQLVPRAHPQRGCDWALFLDVDGTLLDIATSPGGVHVPARVRHALRMALEREHGAVALVSGRTIADLDRLFAPLHLAAAGVHGLERRDALGHLRRPEVATGDLDIVRRQLAGLASAHPGLELEDKHGSLALHFRMAPHLERPLQALFDELRRSLAPQFQILAGKYCLEVKPAAATRRAAIEAFLCEPPFAGRLPVFVGDDSSDEDGFEAVNDLGGLSIRVGYAPGTAARWRLANVNAVLGWLQMPHLPHAKPVPR